MDGVPEGLVAFGRGERFVRVDAAFCYPVGDESGRSNVNLDQIPEDSVFDAAFHVSGG